MAANQTTAATTTCRFSIPVAFTRHVTYNAVEFLMCLSSAFFSFWRHSFMSSPVGTPRDGQIAKTVHSPITPV
ncbi:hypothetical protein MHPYR_430035 [uncultured Mycobacterium sp.]|uniref:Uncharacterized protein n=1 Tax=uncultured Mycobacterium sp. TaxID=171292 RepID=A0A1Y5PFG0_9MYCO|nr:hypothetical protein MHPYR_430035 [uncultured Mycobacterium sp.]